MRSRLTRSTAYALALTTGFASSAVAQIGVADRTVPGTYAITNARIVPVSGPTINRGTIVIRDGLIVAIGANVQAPADARVIDGAGLSVVEVPITFVERAEGESKMSPDVTREAVVRGLVHWRLHLVILTATFALFPALTVGLASLPPWISPPELAAGLVLLGCLPSTIQSSIAFVGIARGNVAAAVAAASASNH